uniref:CCHC-type domain-containing protein n=1 Tax=Fagus sylvatica TaxID=28930 RepID=A0A2N9I9N7_FAGSY
MNTAREVWECLEAKYLQATKERELQLRRQLQMPKKDNVSLDTYLRNFKSICDSLAAIQKSVSDEDKTIQLSHCLGTKYDVFVTTMLSKPPFPTFNQFVTALQNYAMRFESTDADDKGGANHNFAFVTHRGGGRGRGRGRHSGPQFTSRGRGFGAANHHNYNTGRGHFAPHNPRPSPPSQHTSIMGQPSIVMSQQGGQQQQQHMSPNNQQYIAHSNATSCQICGRFGHIARKCWYRFDYAYENLENLSQALACTTLSDSQDHDSHWYTDTGATSHMTSTAGNLHSSSPYYGHDYVVVGNGTRLPISHVGNTILSSQHGDLNLHDIKDKFTGRIMATGRKYQGLYALDSGGAVAALAAIRTGKAPHVSCPGTPEQNGVAERKHRHIVETGLTMLFHARLPKNLWIEAFMTAVYLINRLPSSTIAMATPFFKLHGVNPDYNSLKVFGCRCFPYLRDYAKNKFEPKSYPCIFLGYSPIHKGYRCLHPPTKRVYLSRHVVFDEDIFPYADPRSLFSSTSTNGQFSTYAECINGFLSSSTPNQSHGATSSFSAPTPDKLPGILPSPEPHNSSSPVPPISPPMMPFMVSPTTNSIPLESTPESSTGPCTSTLMALPDQVPATSSCDPIALPTSAPVTFTSDLTPGPITPTRVATHSPPEPTHLDTDQTCIEIVPTSDTLSSSTTPALLVPPLSPAPVLPMSPSVIPHSSQPSTFYIDLPIAPLPDTTPPQPTNTHPMITRRKAREHSCHIVLKPTDPNEPKSIKSALQSPHWLQAMRDEILALQKNHTWVLVPRQSDMNIVGSRWVFKTKLKSDGSIERFKARLVAKGYNQLEGLDFHETFSPVVKSTTIRLVLSLATTKGWPLRQLDVKNAFLHGHLKEVVYMEQPPGFSDSSCPTHVCRLHKAIYGLKQAPRAWFDRFSSFLLHLGFYCSPADSSLFVFRSSSHIILLLVYVDDIIVTSNHSSSLSTLITKLSSEFSMKDLGPLHYFLGIQVSHFSDGIFLSQQKYAREILAKASMTDCKPIGTPLAQKHRLQLEGGPLVDATNYRSIVGALQYLTLTRPDLTHAVNLVCQFMHQPGSSHFQAVKRILRYLQGTLAYGIRILSHSSLTLYGFSDADWAGCPDTRRSTTGYCIYLGANCISWASKKQATVSRSSAEAEYRAMASAAAELTWLTYLLHDLGISLPTPPVLFCDNTSALHMTVNPVFHARTKHIELDFHFVREKVAAGALTTRYVPSQSQIADLFTKAVSKDVFHRFRHKLGVLPPPPSSLRGTDKEIF